MKKTVLIPALAALFFGSCITMNYGGKKPIFLVDAPGDLAVKSKGKELEIKPYVAFTETTGPKGFQTKTRYKYPGVLLRVKGRNKLELLSKNREVPVSIKGNPAVGIVIMVLELPFTMGVGTIVDLACTSYFFPKTRYIDVKACMNKTQPRSQKELRRAVQSANYTRMD